ncbi:hypothetical protein pb186bvf_018812 [Paramecium bursaria]
MISTEDSTKPISLLKLRKNSKSFGTDFRQIKVLYYTDSLIQLEDQFSLDLTINEVMIWAVKKLNSEGRQIKYQECKMCVPKKSGKPNEDFPSFDLKMILRETDQDRFSIKVCIPKNQVITPSPIITSQSQVATPRKVSYQNSLIRSKTDQKAQQKKPYYCFCGSDD